jgi:DNA-directed RNA polymerase specialized sigma24 family protein
MMLVVKRCAWAISDRERPYGTRCELSPTDALGGDGEATVVVANTGLDPHEVVEQADRCRADLAAIDRLKPDERTALILFGLGYSYREIGELRSWTHTKV